MNYRFFKVFGTTLIMALSSTNVLSEETNNSLIIELEDTSRTGILKITKRLKSYGVKSLSYSLGSPKITEDERSKSIDKDLKLFRGRSIDKKRKKEIVQRITANLAAQAEVLESLKRSDTVMTRSHARFITVSLKKGVDSEDAKNKISSSLGLNVSINQLVETEALPNEAFVDRNQDNILDNNPNTGMPYSWGLQRIKAFEAISKHNVRGNGIVIAVIDDGIDFRHADLAPNIWRNPREIPANGRDDDGNGYVDDVVGYDLLAHKAGNCPRTGANRCGAGYTGMSDYHGTTVASVVAAAQNNSGNYGVANRSRIMPVRVLGDELFNGRPVYGDAALIAEGIRYAADNGASVINVSLGTTFTDANSASSRAIISLLTEAVNYATSRGRIVVASSGNGQLNSSGVRVGVNNHTIYPGAVPNAITVAATGYDNALTSFSNFGALTDIAAPGRDIVTSLPNCFFGCGAGNGYDYTFYSDGSGRRGMNGTSYSAPLVAGAIGLMLEKKPSARISEIEQALYTSAAPLAYSAGNTIRSGSGILNVEAALDRIAPVTPPPASNICTNPVCRFDVSGNGMISPFDALVVINAINGTTVTPPNCVDVDRDGVLSPNDALAIINKLNSGNWSC